MKSQNYRIRQENATDWPAIYSLIRIAFETAKVKDGDEQDFATGLRTSERYIPELSLVAEQDGMLIGHVMLTHTVLHQDTGEDVDVLLLAPLSVLLEYRNRGVGGALVEEACRTAKELGYTAVFLCGDPAYYNRFGFRQSSGWGITAIQSIPDQYVLVKELKEGFLDSVQGKIECC